MAITQKAGGRWYGLNADLKPTLGTEQIGHVFYETDGQSLKSIWNGTSWELQAGT